VGAGQYDLLKIKIKTFSKRRKYNFFICVESFGSRTIPFLKSLARLPHQSVPKVRICFQTVRLLLESERFFSIQL